MAGTDRLYFEDSTILEFESDVLDVIDRDGQALVVLERTAFYPEGGGQPPDQGLLGEARVVDVQEHGGVIEHTVEGNVPAIGSRVHGKVDSARRFDHMQQHTGQHLLSRTFIEVMGADTLSFHMGVRSCTIDLPVSAIADNDLDKIAEEAGKVIRENRTVSVSLHTDVSGLPPDLRKESAVEGPLRVVDIDGYDRCPCGGTHVARTGEIEAIVIRRVERISEGHCRVEFLCGGRARKDHQMRVDRDRSLVRVLSVEDSDIAESVDRMKNRLRVAEKRVKELERELLPQRVLQLVAEGEELGGFCLVTRLLEEHESANMKPLAQALAREDRVVALLGSESERGQLAVSIPDGLALAADEFLKDLVSGANGRGGGSARVAQAGVSDPGVVKELLERGAEQIRGILDSADEAVEKGGDISG